MGKQSITTFSIKLKMIKQNTELFSFCVLRVYTQGDSIHVWKISDLSCASVLSFMWLFSPHQTASAGSINFLQLRVCLNMLKYLLLRFH